MASQQIKARRRAVALLRLQEAQRRIAQLLQTAVPPVARTNQDAELAQIQETEAVADFLEAVWPPLLEMAGNHLPAQGQATQTVVLAGNPPRRGRKT